MFADILSDKVSRLSIFAGVLFFIMASTPFLERAVVLLNSVCKVVNINCTMKGNVLLLVNSVIFAAVMWVSVTYVMTPVYDRVEQRLQ